MIAEITNEFYLRIIGDGGWWRASKYFYKGQQYKIKRVNKKTVTVEHCNQYNCWTAKLPIENVKIN